MGVTPILDSFLPPHTRYRTIASSSLRPSRALYIHLRRIGTLRCAVDQMAPLYRRGLDCVHHTFRDTSDRTNLLAGNDVEAVFLFPWAVIFLQQKVDHANSIPFYAMLLFLGVLSFAIVYAWKKGVLEWQK